MPAVSPASSILTYSDARMLTVSTRATALVFEDPQSKALLHHLRRIAPSNASIVITGETGTGKELVARYVHEVSERRTDPFIAMNCAAFSESLVESELFGHERGAFTGAISTRAGWFEAANGGTLFLDEIGDLPLSMQVKLLRVLQEREVVRLGSRQPIPIDVRLIAATNINLEEAVEAGRFRTDLYYRLNVAALRLLPLRERPGDILPLAHHFLSEYSSRLGCATAAFAPETLQQLENYPWPGNIRELENVIHHALLVCHDNLVRPADLHLAPLQPKTSVVRTIATNPLEGILFELFAQNAPNLYESLTETIVRTAYRYCRNNQVQTARLLGISRNILRSHLKQLGLIGGSADAMDGRVEADV
jgi:sigma-54-specific transcriptional regulator